MGSSEGHSGAVRTTSGNDEYELIFCGAPFCFANIFVPFTEKWFCTQNLHMDISFQKKKNGLENCVLVPERLNKYNTNTFHTNIV